MGTHNQIKNERKAIYFDLICGVISSVIALSGITFVAISGRVTSIGWFTASVVFWGLYFLFSILMIIFGLYSNYKSKNFDPSKYKKDIKPPII